MKEKTHGDNYIRREYTIKNTHLADYTHNGVYTGRKAMYVGDIMEREYTHMEETTYGRDYIRKKLHMVETTNERGTQRGHDIR